MTKDSFNVVIVGAGIAGLATAHAIERAKSQGRGQNVRVTVYERQADESNFSRYPIWLAPDGRAALRNILSPSEFDQLLTVSDHGLTHGGISILLPSLQNLFSVRRYEGQTPFAIHRWLLKDALEQGVNVQRGRRVVKVNRQDSKAEVVFDNGTHELADLVIGADGMGSILRAQLYPEMGRFPTLPYLTVQFKLLPRTHLNLHDPHGINTITGTRSYALLMIPLSGHPVPQLPASARENNPFASNEDIEPTLKALDQPNPDYIFCACSLKMFHGWEDMTPVSWIDKMATLLESDRGDANLIKTIREDVVPQTVGAWQVVCCDDKDPLEWKGGRTVLIGDAAHTMPPQGGAGGATSLCDAQALAEVIVSSDEAGGQGGPIDALLPSFHRQMLTRAYGYMKDAKRRLHLSMKEGYAVYWQRALLTIMSWIWPLAHWVLSRGQVSARAAANRQ